VVLEVEVSEGPDYEPTMGTHNLTPDQKDALIHDYLQPEVVPLAVAALEAAGYYMTAELPRPASEVLTDVFRAATGREVGHMATPPEDPFDVYFFVEEPWVDLDAIRRLAAEKSARAR